MGPQRQKDLSHECRCYVVSSEDWKLTAPTSVQGEGNGDIYEKDGVDIEESISRHFTLSDYFPLSR